MTQTIQVSHDNFTDALERWAANNPKDAAFVTLEVPETAEFHLAVEGNAGVGITQGGELIALFNHNAPDGTGAALVELAKERGANHLWCFETGLEKFYRKFGFTETERFPWDEDKAPENWAYDKFGTPDLLKMEL
jgi:hypothetical protein